MLQIPPDYTFLVQIALFVAVWLALKSLWFDPALKVIKERSARSEGAIADARAVQAEAERLQREHETALADARAAAQREAQELMRAAEAEQKRLLTDATEAAQLTLADARARVAEDVAAARRTLQAEVGTLAREVARAVVGRAV